MSLRHWLGFPGPHPPSPRARHWISRCPAASNPTMTSSWHAFCIA